MRKNAEIGMRNRVELGEWRVEFRIAAILWRAAVAASAPSEEGAGAPKGYKGATEGERTRGCCLHQGVDIHKVIQVSLLFSTRLYLLLSHILGVSLLPSRRFNPLYAVPPPSSEGGEGAPAPCKDLQLYKPRLSPPLAGCPHPSRCSAKAQRRATFPKGKAKEAEPQLVPAG